MNYRAGETPNRYPGVPQSIVDSLLSGAPEMAIARVGWVMEQSKTSPKAFLLLLDALMERDEHIVKDAARKAVMKTIEGARYFHADDRVSEINSWMPRREKIIEPLSYGREKGTLFVNLLKAEERKKALLLAAKGLEDNLEYVERMVAAKAMLELLGKRGEREEIVTAVKGIINKLVRIKEEDAVIFILPGLGEMRENNAAVEVLGSLLDNKALSVGGKCEVIRQFLFIGGHEALEQLKKAVGDERVGVRLEAYLVIEGLEYLDMEGSGNKVEQVIARGALNMNEKPRVRIELINWMGEHGKDVLVPLEQIIGQETDEEVIAAAEKASLRVGKRMQQQDSGERTSDKPTLTPGAIGVGSTKGEKCSPDEKTGAISAGPARWGKGPLKRKIIGAAQRRETPEKKLLKRKLNS